MSNNFKFKIEKIADHYAAVSRAIGKLSHTAVLAGIPEDKASRKEDEINNATLGYIHENGSDRAHLPPRPFLKPGVERAQKEITKHLADAGAAASRGEEGKMDGELNKAGQVAVNSIRGVFVDNDWPAVKESTQRRKGEGKTTTLVNSGELRKSITYVVDGDEQ